MSSAPSFGVTLPKYQQPKAGTCPEQHLPFCRVPTPFTRWPGVSLSLSHTHTAPQLPGDACGDSDLLSIPPADRGREGTAARVPGRSGVPHIPPGRQVAVEGPHLSTQDNPQGNSRRAYLSRRVETDSLSGAAFKGLWVLFCFFLTELD